MKSKKSALLLSFTSLLLCFAMLVGSTFAWFTDTATTGVNKITSGNLHVEIQDKTGEKIENLEWVKEDGTVIADQDKILWEPGCTYLLTPFKIVNTGNLALKYKIVITGLDGDSPLLDVIKFTYKINGVESSLEDEGHLTAKGTEGAATKMITVSAHMDKTANNDYQDKTLENVKFTVYATQLNSENDSFGPNYDKDATYYPVLDAAGLKDALVNGGNIKVDDDVAVAPVVEDVTVSTLVPQMTLTKDTTLDLSGNKISVQHDETPDFGSASPVLMAVTDGTLTIEGNGEINCEAGDQQVYGINVNGGNVVVNDGKFYGAITAIQVQKGSLVINGGFFDMAPTCKAQVPHYAKYVINCIDANYKNGTAKIIVKGGTFVNFDPSANPEGEGTTYVADGYSVISEQHGADTWYTVVKGQGATAGTQDALNNAIRDNTSPTVTVKLTEAGTYTLPVLSGRDITIVGTKDTVVDMKDKTNGATNIGFEGVTVEFGTSNFVGFQHTGKLTYKDCTIKGKQILYAKDTEFVNCVFEQTAADYNLWTYGGNVTFTDCTFISNGKFINAYRQQNTADGEVTNLTLTNCKFVNTGSANKAAVNIKSQMAWNVVITSCTTEGEFPAENNGLWQSAPDDGAAVAPGNTVTVN